MENNRIQMVILLYIKTHTVEEVEKKEKEEEV